MSQETNEEQQNENGAVQVYKKWRQSSGEGGFISFQYWPKNHKVIVDIGTTSKEGGLKDNAKCFVNASQFMAYTKADVEGRVDYLFPKFFSPEIKDSGWASFGGSTSGGMTVARVFKVTYWPNDPSSRDFKCAHFIGKPTGQGAIVPDFNQPLKSEHIKMTMFELAEMYEKMALTIFVHNIHDKLENLVFEESS